MTDKLDNIDTEALFSQLDEIKKDQVKLLQQHLEAERPLDLEYGWTNLAEAKAAQQVFNHNGELMAKKEQQISELMGKVYRSRFHKIANFKLIYLLFIQTIQMQKLSDKTYI